jgi:hypothetical protein
LDVSAPDQHDKSLLGGCHKLEDHADVSSLLQVSTDIKHTGKMKTSADAVKRSSSAKWHALAGAFTANQVSKSLSLQSLSAQLGNREIGSSVMAIMVLMLVLGPLLVAMLFSMFLMEPTKSIRGVPDGKEERGCLCCPWPLRGHHAPKEDVQQEKAAPERRMPVFYNAAGYVGDGPSRGQDRGMADPNDPAQNEGDNSLGLMQSMPLHGGSANIYHDEAPQSLQRENTPLHGLPEEVLQESMIVPQPEGLTLHIFGPAILPLEQQSTLKVYMNWGNVDSRQIMSIFCAEQSGDKGILCQSTQHFPIAFLDTRMAISWNVKPPRVKRHVKILDKVPGHGERVEDYICVEPSEHHHYDVLKVRGDVTCGKWLSIRCVEDSMNIVDKSNRLIATFELKSKDEHGHTAYVVEVAHGVDASLVLASCVGVLKLQTEHLKA